LSNPSYHGTNHENEKHLSYTEEELIGLQNVSLHYFKICSVGNMELIEVSDFFSVIVFARVTEIFPSQTDNKARIQTMIPLSI
jgi:hypothetical protein